MKRGMLSGSCRHAERFMSVSFVFNGAVWFFISLRFYFYAFFYSPVPILETSTE